MEGIGADLEVMRPVPLAAKHVDAIRAIGRERSYDAGGMIARVGDPMDRFLYVLEGEIEHPSPREVARQLGMDLDIGNDLRIDILIVGGCPAGVAAAVNAGAEGLSALVVEDTAIGGQAGASSRIENYMGFPTGISGADLVFRGQIQALRFGSCFAMPRRVERLSAETGGLFSASLDDGSRVFARAVPVATGVGGGNSAGQAAMYLSRFAPHAHILVRGETLSDAMSSYLLRRLEAQTNIEIHFGTEVTALHGADHLEAIAVRSKAGRVCGRRRIGRGFRNL